jgi:hypothetical protein
LRHLEVNCHVTELKLPGRVLFAWHLLVRLMLFRCFFCTMDSARLNEFVWSLHYRITA